MCILFARKLCRNFLLLCDNMYLQWGVIAPVVANHYIAQAIWFSLLQITLFFFFKENKNN
jgi:hypothetical protein